MSNILEIALVPDQSQEFTVTIDDKLWLIRIKLGKEYVFMDVEIEGLPIVYGLLCVTNVPILEKLVWLDSNRPEEDPQPIDGGIGERWRLFLIGQTI